MTRAVFTALIFLSVLQMVAQVNPAQLDSDYRYFTETDEVGTNYNVHSYFLKNSSDHKIVFFNFRLQDDVPGIEMLKTLPDDVLVIDPQRTAKICQAKFTNGEPAFLWQAYFLEPSVGFSKFPEQEKHYVFFWKTTEKDGLVINDYFIKSLSDNRMKFHDFETVIPEGIRVTEDKTSSFVYLEPRGRIKLLSYEALNDSETPRISWRSTFTSFQPGNDEFCNQFIIIMESAGEGDFGSIKGIMIRENVFSCQVSISDLSQSEISGIDNVWWFIGRLGEPSDKKTIEKRLSHYSEVLDNCLPDVLVPEEKKDKSTGNRYLKFAGLMGDKQHEVTLKAEGSAAEPLNFQLKLLVKGAQ
jgi:hypothetical protein